MKTLLIILSCLIISIFVLFLILTVMSKHGKAVGLVDGHLAKCPNKPNCVCTEYKKEFDHYLSPIIMTQNSDSNSLATIKKSIQSMNGIIQVENSNYIVATFSSAFFGFVDDLEVRIDTNRHLIHIRSASRVGHSDFGVNKKRVELLKQLYIEELGDH